VTLGGAIIAFLQKLPTEDRRQVPAWGMWTRGLRHLAAGSAPSGYRPFGYGTADHAGSAGQQNHGGMTRVWLRRIISVADAAMSATQTPTGIGSMTLEHLGREVSCIEGVRETDVQPGDWVIVRTRNSTYVLRANGDGTFDASGGWFSRHEGSTRRLRVIGCTWGGSAVLTRMIAACGMFLEFSNCVLTTRIREVRHIRPIVSPTVH
jgi:hypothetical protein